MKYIYTLLIIFCMSSLFGGTIEPNNSDKSYIDLGQNFTYVGQIYGSYNDETLYSASGVAIDDHHVLTAAHIVDNAELAIFKINGDEFVLNRIIIHKSFSVSKFGCADIALAYSEKPFNLKKYPELYKDTDEIGKICTISGYGFTGNFIIGAKKYDNKLRAGNNNIDSIDKDLLVCNASRKNEHNATHLEFLIASGDSGGGLFIDDKLAGINSCVFGNSKALMSKYNDQSGHTRVSSFVEWVERNKVIK